MDLKVTGRKMQVSDTLREYVTEKLGNAVKVFDIEPMTAEAVLHVEKNRSNPRSAVAEITLRTKGFLPTLFILLLCIAGGAALVYAVRAKKEETK